MQHVEIAVDDALAVLQEMAIGDIPREMAVKLQLVSNVMQKCMRV